MGYALAAVVRPRERGGPGHHPVAWCAPCAVQRNLTVIACDNYAAAYSWDGWHESRMKSDVKISWISHASHARHLTRGRLSGTHAHFSIILPYQQYTLRVTRCHVCILHMYRVKCDLTCHFCMACPAWSALAGWSLLVTMPRARVAQCKRTLFPPASAKEGVAVCGVLACLLLCPLWLAPVRVMIYRRSPSPGVCARVAALLHLRPSLAA